MSIADLKSRMADIPGIEGLTARLSGGRQIFMLGDRFASTTAYASDREIEDAIRKAVLLPAVSPVPEQRKVQTMGSVTGASFLGGSIKAKIQAAKDKIAAGHVALDAAVTKLDGAAEQSASLAKSISDEADALLADIGQFTNGNPET